MSSLGRQARLTFRVLAAVLRNRSLRHAQAAFLGFNAVEYGTWTAALLYAYEATGPVSVGVVALVMLVPAALVAPAAATAADRYDRRRVLLASYVAYSVTLGLTATAMLGGWPPALVYASASIASVSLTLTRPTHGAILPSLSRSPEELTAANGVSGMAEGAGWILGPLVGAAVLAVSTPGAVLALGAIVCLVGAVLILAISPVARAGSLPLAAASADADNPGYRSMLAGGLRALAHDADARLVVAVMSARMLMIGVMDVLMVLMAFELFGTGESGASLLNAALGTGTIVGGAAAFTLIARRQLSVVVLLAAVIWGVALALVGVVATGATAPLLLAAGSIGLAVIDVAGRTILQRTVDDEVLARVFGVLEGLAMAGLAAGSILVPLIVGLVGLEPAILVFAALLPVLVGLTWARLRGLDARAVIPTRELALLQRVRIFELLPAPYAETVARRSRWVSVPAGSVVIRQGDVGDRFYVLERGRVRVNRDGLDVRDFLEPGDAFGEIALLRDVPRTATVAALEDTVLLALERADFLAAVTRHPQAMTEAHRLADERDAPRATRA